MFNINNLKIAPVNRVVEIIKSGEANALLTVLSKVEFNTFYNKEVFKEEVNIPVFDYNYNESTSFENIAEYIKPEDWQIITFEDYEGGSNPVELPTEQEISKGIAFGVKKLDEGKKLLVHCQMGMSRSPAMAYLIMCHYMDPQDAANNLFKIRQGIKPNLYIIEIGDRILKLNGKAVQAMKNRLQVNREMRDSFRNQFSSTKG